MPCRNVRYGLLLQRCGCGGTHGNVTENGQQDVDEEVGIAAALEKDTERRDEDGKDDLADVGSGERHRVYGLILSKRSLIVVDVWVV